MQPFQIGARQIAFTLSSFYMLLTFSVRLVGALVNGYSALIPENIGLFFAVYGYAIGYIFTFKKPLLGGILLLFSTMAWELDLISNGLSLSINQLFFTLLPSFLFMFSSWNTDKWS